MASPRLGLFGAVAVLVMQSLGCEGEAAVDAGRVDILTGPPQISIGDLEEDSTQVLGAVADVLPLGDDLVAVADQFNSVIRVYDREGGYRLAVGRKGEGPGEFSRVVALALLAADTVIALDSELLRLTVFEAGDSLWSVLRTVQLPFQAHDVCVAGGRVFLLGLWEDLAVHEVTLDGEVLSSFGDTPNPGPAVGGPFLAGLKAHNARGRLACSEQADMVAVLPHILPTVRAFDLSGQLLWEAVLSDYRATQFNLTDRGTLQLGLDPATATVHTSWGLFFLGPGFLGVSLLEKSWDTRTYELRVLLSADGHQVASERPSAGYVLIRDAAGWYVREEPFPHVGTAPLSVRRAGAG